MKEIILSAFLLSLLVMLSSVSACSMQSNPNTQQQQSIDTLIPLSPKLQIGEYLVNAFQDSKAHLWFGTVSKGVARYDGQSLRYFSTRNGLCDNTVVSVIEDKEGNLWFGTHAGVSKFDGKTFQNFTESSGIHGMGAMLLLDRHDNIWVGTNHGVFRLTGNFFTEFKIPRPKIDSLSYKWEAGKIWDIIEDSKGNIWFGTDGYGACKYDGKTFTHFTQKDGLCSNVVSDIVEDQQGNIWFASISYDFPEYRQVGGLCRYDGTTFTKFPKLKGLSQSDIYTLYLEKSGALWIGAIGHGAYRYDGKEFKLFNEIYPQGYAYNFAIQAVLEDQESRLWFGFSGGLFRFDGQRFFNITQDGPWD